MELIRPETPQDYAQIEAILRRCFSQEPQNEDFNEWVLVRQIREDCDYLPSLSLVAEENGVIVGHVLFSRCTIGGTPLLALAPLAVHPDYRRRGIGQRLVEMGLEIASIQKEKNVLVLGGPYYRRFGFRPIPSGITLREDLNAHVQLLELEEGSAERLSGQVRYCAPFYDKDGNLL